MSFPRMYIGTTGNIKRRLQLHNNGTTPSTKPYRPWKILRVEEYTSKAEAQKREKQLKRSGVARKQLKTNPESYMPPSSIG